MPEFHCFVPGCPKTAGSKTAFPIRTKDGKPVYKDGRQVIAMVDASGKAGKVWRNDVRNVVAPKFAAFSKSPLTCRVELCCWFIFARPKSHYGTGKNAGTVKASAPAVEDHLQAPDALKLTRAVEDALTGIVWKDDCQCFGSQEKRWTAPPHPNQGAWLRIKWK